MYFVSSDQEKADEGAGDWTTVEGCQIHDRRSGFIKRSRYAVHRSGVTL